MTSRQVPVSLDESLVAAAALAAGRRGLTLSAWLGRAARRELAVEDGLAAVSEWEAEHGELTAEERAEADATLDRLLGHPTP